MSKCYGHITPQQRLRIHQLLIQGCAIQEIAEKLGYHRATLYRELARVVRDFLNFLEPWVNRRSQMDDDISSMSNGGKKSCVIFALLSCGRVCKARVNFN